LAGFGAGVVFEELVADELLEDEVFALWVDEEVEEELELLDVEEDVVVLGVEDEDALVLGVDEVVVLVPEVEEEVLLLGVDEDVVVLGVEEDVVVCAVEEVVVLGVEDEELVLGVEDDVVVLGVDDEVVVLRVDELVLLGVEEVLVAAVVEDVVSLGGEDVVAADVVLGAEEEVLLDVLGVDATDALTVDADEPLVDSPKHPVSARLAPAIITETNENFAAMSPSANRRRNCLESATSGWNHVTEFGAAISFSISPRGFPLVLDLTIQSRRAARVSLQNALHQKYFL
jgi:hypothetical protein